MEHPKQRRLRSSSRPSTDQDTDNDAVVPDDSSDDEDSEDDNVAVPVAAPAQHGADPTHGEATILRQTPQGRRSMQELLRQQLQQPGQQRSVNPLQQVRLMRSTTVRLQQRHS